MNVHLLSEFALIVFVFMNLMFINALRLKDNSIVDIGWGIGFIIISLWGMIRGSANAVPMLSFALISLWGLRLAFYIYGRNKGKGEDFRYAAWRKEWGSSVVWRSYLQVFLLQGMFMVVIASPLLAIFGADRGAISWNVVAGAIVFAIGFYFEAVGDAQMKAFKAAPANKGRIMREGLWRYTRHPNYFGEALLWWGFALISWQTETWYLSLIGPAVLTFLLLKVSGVAMLERKYDGNPKYADYVHSTNAFLPWFPKRPH